MKLGTNGAVRFWVHGWKLVDEFTADSPQQQARLPDQTASRSVRRALLNATGQSRFTLSRW